MDLSGRDHSFASLYICKALSIFKNSISGFEKMLPSDCMPGFVV